MGAIFLALFHGRGKPRQVVAGVWATLEKAEPKLIARNSETELRDIVGDAQFKWATSRGKVGN
jgi:hypothetical protein